MVKNKDNIRYIVCNEMPSTTLELIHNLNFIWSVWLDEEKSRYIELRLNQQAFLLGGTLPEDSFVNQMLHWNLRYGNSLFTNIDGSSSQGIIYLYTDAQITKLINNRTVKNVDVNTGQIVDVDQANIYEEIVKFRREVFTHYSKPRLCTFLQEHGRTYLNLVEQHLLGANKADDIKLDMLEAELISSISDLTIEELENYQLFIT